MSVFWKSTYVGASEVNLCRCFGSQPTSVFQKSTHTDKTAVIPTLQYRGRMLLSLVKALRDEESRLLMHVLVRNGYPKKLTSQQMRDRERVEESVNGQPEATLCLPYVSRVSEVLKRVLVSFGGRTVLKPL